MSNLRKLERLLTNYEVARDDELAERVVEARARIVTRHWVANPKVARYLAARDKELLDEALQTALLSWGARL